MDMWFPYSRQPVFISDLEGRRKWGTYGQDSVSNHSLQMVKISCNFASNLCQKTGWDGNCLNILYNKSIHVLLLPLWLVDFWKLLSFTVLPMVREYICNYIYSFFIAQPKKMTSSIHTWILSKPLKFLMENYEWKDFQNGFFNCSAAIS